MGDRYTITERVDQGGMAEVFRGVAESIQGFKKAVAIKRILPTLTKNKKFVSMFLDEARLSLHLQHANIVHVFDIGIGADTAYFIVMEYVDGANLKSITEFHKRQGRRIKVAHTIYLMIEVCKGLAYAHEVSDPESGKPLGIVHRDISPPNILISKMGEVKLVDFGLAKATSQLETTDPGVVKGKFSYLSPEMASAQEIDHRSDLFAVGILLWEMLTGRRLFYGETDYQTVELVRQAKVPPIGPLNPDVDADIEAVVRKTLARDPRDRYPHAADLQDALAQILFSKGLKVTSRDIAALVREVVADREKSKPATPKVRGLIDALIQEEIAKFTSLDEVGANTPDGVAGAKPLSPEEVSGVQPLNSDAFVDTRGWIDDLAMDSPHAAATAPTLTSPTDGRTASALKSAPPARAPRGSGERQAVPPPRPVAEPSEIESLQQILEPDKTGVKKKSGGESNTVMWLIVAIAVLVVGIGAGLFVFKDQIFGGTKSAPTRKP